MELLLQNVTKSFGGLRAVSDVSFSVKDNVIFGLIGPNGAGKTTVFNLITGVYKHDSGSITFGSTDIGKLKPAEIAGAGIARTFQNIRLFGQLTVIENLLVACELQKRAHLAAAVLRSPVHYEDELAMHERALELLRVFDLHDMADEVPTSLSYGNQRRLEIARAMMLRPKLLLLDEPAAGMNYGEAEGLKTQIRWLRDTFDLSIVLVEHNMQVVMGVCEEIHVLDHGETIAHGPPEAIRKDPKVLAAYLGEEESAQSVLEAVKEASCPDVGKLVPPSSPRLSKVAPGPDLKLVADLPADSRPLSDPELDEISRDLIQNLERRLSQPDADEVVADLSPKSEPPASLADPAKDASSPAATKRPEKVEPKPISAPPSPFVKVAEPKEAAPVSAPPPSSISVPPPSPFVKVAEPKEEPSPISVPPPSPLANSPDAFPPASPRPRMITLPLISEAELGEAMPKEEKEKDASAGSPHEPLPRMPEPFVLAESARKIPVAKPVAVPSAPMPASSKKEDGR
jgi:branched-chain amino acid transport system ATP-binding protein